MSLDDLLLDAKRKPVCVSTSGEDDTKPERSPVGKAPPISSCLEQQSSVSSVFSLCVPLKVCLSTDDPTTMKDGGRQPELGWQPALVVGDRLKGLCHH